MTKKTTPTPKGIRTADATGPQAKPEAGLSDFERALALLRAQLQRANFERTRAELALDQAEERIAHLERVIAAAEGDR